MTDGGATYPLHPPEDPTKRTIETGQRELAQLERRLLDRLEAIEKAQEKFEESITRVPTDVDKQVGQLRELLESKIEALAVLLKSILDANARLAETQQKASEAAIGKTERSVEDRLRELTTLFRSEIGSLAEKIQASGERLNQFESRTAGASDARATAQDAQKLWMAIIGVVLTMAVAFTGLVTFLNRPVPQPQVRERVIERQAGPSTVIERPNQVVVPDDTP